MAASSDNSNRRSDSNKRSSSAGRPPRSGGSKPTGSNGRPQRGGKGRTSGPGRPATSDRRTSSNGSSGSRDSRPTRSNTSERERGSSQGRKPATTRPASGPEDFRDGLGDIDVSILPRDVVADLDILTPGVKARVERWLAATRLALEDDPQQAYEYAQEAGRIGGRSSVVREAVGIAAYHAGEFAAARKDLQAARRIGGRDDLIPLIADCERALGHPRKAVELANTPEAKRLRGETQAELLLVTSGARLDLDQTNAAVSVLRGPASNTPANAPWAARIFYGYAEALLADGDTDAARDWFLKAASVDDYGTTDAQDRIAELDASS